MKYSGLGLGLAVVAGAMVGGWAKQLTSPPAPGVEVSPPAKIERTVPAAIPEAAEPTLDELLRAGDPARHSKLVSALPGAGAAELQALWEAWKDDPAMAGYRRFVLARWVEVDVPAARAAAGDDPAFWEAWIAFDPEAAYAAGRESTDPLVPSRVRKLLVARDPELARKLIAANGGNVTPRELASGYLAHGRYREAIEAADEAGQRSRFHDIFKDWIKADPEGALDWAAATGFTTGSSGISDEKRILELVRPHADKLRTLVRRLPAGAFRQRLEAGLVTALAEKDPQSAIGYARELPSPRSRRHALAAAGMGLAKSDPDAALAIYTELVASGARRGDETLLVLYGEEEGVTRRDNPFDPFSDAMFDGLPGRTLEAVAGMDETPESDAAVEDLSSRWMSRDLWGFSKWLASQPESQRRDAMAGGLVGRVLEESNPNFEEAAQWVGAIGDAGIATSRARQVVESWRATDPAGLESYVQSDEAPKVIVENFRSDR